MTPDEVKKIRKTLGVSQEKFAQLLGATVVTINRWENGKSCPSRLYMRELKELRIDHKSNGTETLQCKEELRNVDYDTNNVQLRQPKEPILKNKIQESLTKTSLHRVTTLDQRIHDMFIDCPEMGVVMTVLVKTLFRRKAKDSAEQEIKERIEKMSSHIEKIREFQDKHSEEFRNIHEEFHLYVPCYTQELCTMSATILSMTIGQDIRNLEKTIQERIELASRNTISMSYSEISFLAKMEYSLICDIMRRLNDQGFIRGIKSQGSIKYIENGVMVLNHISKFF